MVPTPINPSLFLVPHTNGNLKVGFGPTLMIPSATDVQLSSQRWSAGQLRLKRLSAQRV